MIGANVVIPSYQAFGFSRAQCGVTPVTRIHVRRFSDYTSLTPLNLLCSLTKGAGHKSCSATPIAPTVDGFIVLAQIL